MSTTHQEEIETMTSLDLAGITILLMMMAFVGWLLIDLGDKERKDRDFHKGYRRYL